MTPADTITLCDRLDASLAGATPGQWGIAGTQGADWGIFQDGADEWLGSFNNARDASLAAQLHNAAPDLIKAARREARLREAAQRVWSAEFHGLTSDIRDQALRALGEILKDAGQ